MTPPSPTSRSPLLPQPQIDPRYTYRSALLNGHTYSYIHVLPPPSVPHRATIILVHGFPDLSFTWRNQIPILTNLGLEVIAPDCLGYGRSDSPPSSHLQPYTFTAVADDLEELCRQLRLNSIILGGHDWGGAVVYRVALLKPDLVSAVFSICTPYAPPSPHYMPLAQQVHKQLPNFGYQLHFASGELEHVVVGRDMIRGFLNALYGARSLGVEGKRGDSAFDVKGKVKTELLTKMGKTRLLSDDVMEFYVTEYARHGINGPLNWYRTREQNYLNELDAFFDGVGTDPSKYKSGGEWVEKIKIKQPTLFVHATKDSALPEWMGRGMDAVIPRLTRRTVEGSHWVCWEKPGEINAILQEWLGGILKGLEGEKSKL